MVVGCKVSFAHIHKVVYTCNGLGNPLHKLHAILCVLILLRLVRIMCKVYCEAVSSRFMYLVLTVLTTRMRPVCYQPRQSCTSPACFFVHKLNVCRHLYSRCIPHENAPMTNNRKHLQAPDLVPAIGSLLDSARHTTPFPRVLLFVHLVVHACAGVSVFL